DPERRHGDRDRPERRQQRPAEHGGPDERERPEEPHPRVVERAGLREADRERVAEGYDRGGPEPHQEPRQEQEREGVDDQVEREPDRRDEARDDDELADHALAVGVGTDQRVHGEARPGRDAHEHPDLGPAQALRREIHREERQHDPRPAEEADEVEGELEGGEHGGAGSSHVPASGASRNLSAHAPSLTLAEVRLSGDEGGAIPPRWPSPPARTSSRRRSASTSSTRPSPAPPPSSRRASTATRSPASTRSRSCSRRGSAPIAAGSSSARA